MIVQMASSNVGRCLRDKLCAHHSLTIPMRGRVDRGLETPVLAGICRVLVGRIGVEVCGGSTSSVDIPLVCSDLAGPRPFVKVGGGYIGSK